MNDTEVQWTTPAPLWSSVTNLEADKRQFFRQPAILRFATDTFMNDFLGLLETDPGRMNEFIAQPETWRGPSTTPVLAAVNRLPLFAKRLNRSRLALLRAADASGTSAPRSVAAATLPAGQSPLKLYQAAHQRFYLITACLVCRIPGLPDRYINTGNQERAAFVVRRIVNESAMAGEYAFVDGAWQKVENPDSMLAFGEEELPLSPVTYIEADGRKRRLWTALIPVGKREAYVGAPLAASRAKEQGAEITISLPAMQQREALLRALVIEPWKNLVNNAFNIQRKIAQSRVDALASGESTENESQSVAPLIRAERNKAQEGSWYLLLDLANFLQSHFGDNFWATLATPNQSRQPFRALQQTQLTATLVDELEVNTQHPNVTGLTSLSEALIRVRGQAAKLEIAAKSYTGYGPRPTKPTEAAAWDNETKTMWPDFLFPLVDADRSNPNPTSSDPNDRMPTLRIAQPPGSLDSSLTRPEALKKLIDGLMTTILESLPNELPAPLPPMPLVAQTPLAAGTENLFVIRCVFQRPNCGPLQPIVISDATPVFQFAGFFDPDAPARPIRIALPVDTTPAGLRKFDKNTAFIISDILCGQIDRAKGLGLGDLVMSVLPWPLHKDLSIPDGGPCTDKGDSIGMICSLSIPIITICALILLMIIVSLLDIIFRWIPFFIMCFPLPNFKAKPTPSTP